MRSFPPAMILEAGASLSYLAEIPCPAQTTPHEAANSSMARLSLVGNVPLDGDHHHRQLSTAF